MMTRSFVSTAVGVLFAVATVLVVRPGFAQKMEIDYTCSCSKKSAKTKHSCTGTGAPLVTVPTSANGKTKSRENAARTRCGWVYKSTCPISQCDVTVTPVGQRILTKQDQQRRKNTKNTGIADKHADGLAKYAKENGLTIIVRTTNKKSLPYQQMDRKKYRPKPLALSALKTQKGGKYAGLIVNPDWKALIAAEDTAKTEKAVDAEIKKLQRDCKTVKSEDRKKSFCGWYLDNKGVLRDEKKRAVYGDYDLQGVYKGTKLLDTNDTNEGKALRLELNKAMDPDRKKREDWLIQHGANDNYRKKGKMGREPDMKEDFVVFDSNGDTVKIRNLKALKAYYEAQGIAWPYECPDNCK